MKIIKLGIVIVLLTITSIALLNKFINLNNIEIGEYGIDIDLSGLNTIDTIWILEKVKIAIFIVIGFIIMVILYTLTVSILNYFNLSENDWLDLTFAIRFELKICLIITLFMYLYAKYIHKDWYYSDITSIISFSMGIFFLVVNEIVRRLFIKKYNNGLIKYRRRNFTDESRLSAAIRIIYFIVILQILLIILFIEEHF